MLSEIMSIWQPLNTLNTVITLESVYHSTFNFHTFQKEKTENENSKYPTLDSQTLISTCFTDCFMEIKINWQPLNTFGKIGAVITLE